MMLVFSLPPLSLSSFAANTLSLFHCVNVAVSGCVTTQKCGSCPSSTPYYQQKAGMWDRRAAGVSVTAQCEANDSRKKQQHISSSSVDTICNNNKPVLEASEGNTAASRAQLMGMCVCRAGGCVIVLILKGLSKCHCELGARSPGIIHLHISGNGAPADLGA